MIKEIDVTSWERAEHFAFFSKSDLPFYNVTFNLDVTGLKQIAKEHSLSLTNTIMYLSLKSMIQEKNFLYRIHGTKIIEYDSIDPSFTFLKENESLFRFITTEFDSDLSKFDENCKKAVQSSDKYFDLGKLTGRSNFVFFSMIPWIPFTSIDHTLSLKKDDSIPRVSWGKISKNNEIELLPYNIQVNHRLIDGIHVGKFYETLAREVENMRTTPRSS